MSNYIGNQPSIEIIQNYADKWDYINTGNPAIDTNPSSVGATWLNLTTGEEFVCTDSTAGGNVWKGSLGTVLGLGDYYAGLFGASWHYDFTDQSDIFSDDSGLVTINSGETIAVVKNRVSGGPSLIQTTALLRPRWYNSSGGRGYVMFVPDATNSLCFSSGSSVADTGTPAVTCFLVFHQTEDDFTATPGSASLLNAGHDGTNNRFYFGVGTSYTTGRLGARIGDANAINTSQDLGYGTHILSAKHTNGVYDIRLDNVSIASGTKTLGGGNTSASLSMAGSSTGCPIIAYEAMSFLSELSTTNHDLVFDYLKNKYGL